MAAAVIAVQGAVRSTRRKPCWTGTPEIYFAKPIDNSRLMKIEDPRRSREMRQFGVALSCLFLLVMTYTWQHFKAIEYGYKIAQIDKNIVFRERTGVDQMENMAHRGGLIEHHLGERVEARITRLTELENTAHYLITVVIAEAGTWVAASSRLVEA